MPFREEFIVLLLVQPVIWYNAAAVRSRSVFSTGTGSGLFWPLCREAILLLRLGVLRRDHAGLPEDGPVGMALELRSEEHGVQRDLVRGTVSSSVHSAMPFTRQTS